MLSEHHFQVPDRVFFTLTAVVVLVSAGFVLWAWPLLPTTLPIHFGWDGKPDAYADSKALTVLFPLAIQCLIALLVSWAYRHPNYFNYPTRRRLDTLSLPAQAALRVLARHLLAVVLLVAELLLAHIIEGVILVGLGQVGAPDPSILIFLVGFLLVSITVYSVWMRRIIRRGTADAHPLRG